MPSFRWHFFYLTFLFNFDINGMKVRNNFVSNSSSTSFIVKLPKIPISAEEVRIMVFGKEHYDIVEPWGDARFSTQVVAETLFEEIQKQKPNDYYRALELAENYDGKDQPNLDDFCTGKDEKGYKNYDWKSYNEALSRYGEKVMENFFSIKRLRKQKLNQLKGIPQQSEGNVFYIFEFSDNDGTYNATLEHANIFKRIQHLPISNH